MSASDEEEPRYNEEEDEEEYEHDDEEEDEEYEEDTEYSGVRVAKNDEEEEEEEDDDDNDEVEDEEYEDLAEEDDFSILSNRASELVSQGQNTEAIQVLKVLTQGLVDKLPDLPNLSGEKAEDFRNRVLGTFALWIEIMRDGKFKSSDLADKLSAWQTAFIEDSHLDLLSTESDDEDEDEDDDKAIVKEFSELLEDLKQPSKKKQRA